jgi:hypothetical protein
LFGLDLRGRVLTKATPRYAHPQSPPEQSIAPSRLGSVRLSLIQRSAIPLLRRLFSGNRRSAGQTASRNVGGT